MIKSLCRGVEIGPRFVRRLMGNHHKRVAELAIRSKVSTLRAQSKWVLN
jgi:hypothetical protein